MALENSNNSKERKGIVELAHPKMCNHNSFPDLTRDTNIKTYN